MLKNQCLIPLIKINSDKHYKNLKIFIIAGEASGDVLGGKLINSLQSELKGHQVEFMGVGGKNMIEAGLRTLFDMSELSLMGFLEVVPHLPKLIKRINQTANSITKYKPDIVITIDSPDFCFRVIKKLNKSKITNQIKKVHYVAPTVWAYREKRAEKIAKLYNLLLVILPFEPPYFTKHGLKTEFIGHPIVENKTEIKNNNFRKKYKVSKDDKLICLTPGSRIGEVKRMLPTMIKTVNLLNKTHKNLVAAIPATQKTFEIIKDNLEEFETKVILTKQEEKLKLFDAADVALAKSGTNTVEMSLYELPMVITYKINQITYIFLKMMIKVKFVNLINLILNREIIPEMIQNKCNANDLAKEIDVLLENKENKNNQIKESKRALKLMGFGSQETSSRKAAKKVLEGVIS